VAVTHQSQMRIVKRGPDGLALRTVDKDCRIDLVRLQCTQRSVVAQGNIVMSSVVRPLRANTGSASERSATALSADGDPMVTQLVDMVERVSVAVENHIGR